MGVWKQEWIRATKRKREGEGRIGWAESEKDKYPKENDILQFLREDERHRSPD